MGPSSRFISWCSVLKFTFSTVIVFCNAIVIDAGISLFPFTQAEVYVKVFDLAAFVYMYFTLVIAVELCTLLRYEVIVLK